MTEAQSISEPIRREAADWYLQLSSGQATARDFSAFELWQAGDPQRRPAYERISAMMGDYQAIDDLAQWEPLAALSWRERLASWRERFTGIRRPAWPIQIGAAVAAMLLLTLLATGTIPSLFGPPGYATAIAERREVTLDDGSIVTLGAKSRIEIAYTEETRLVRLIEGEAFFTVAKNKARPFLVAAGETLIRAVGTRFNVNRASGDVRVAVEEGIVEVTPGEKPAKRITATTRRVVRAGEQVMATPGGDLAAVAPVPASQQPGDWRNGRLAYVGAPLEDVIADAGRYYPGRIRFTSDDIRHLRVTMSMRTEEVGKILPELSDILPIIVERKGDELILHARS